LPWVFGLSVICNYTIFVIKHDKDYRIKNFKALTLSSSFMLASTIDPKQETNSIQKGLS